MSRKSKEKNPIQDAYDEGVRSMSDADAHRDMKYSVPSIYRQVCTCFMTQMKRYTKQKSIWFLLLLIIAIPIATYIVNSYSALLFGEYTANENMSAVLIMLPLLGLLIPCIMCGKMLPQEFNERTVYLSLPLPMSRNAMYYGKFLAGFVVSVGLIIAAYGAAMLSCRYIIGSETVYSLPILLSMAIMIGATFFYCSFAYMRSAHSKRGSALFPFILLFVALPIIAYGLTLICELFPTASPISGFVADIMGYMPSFSNDLALANLGSGMTMGSSFSVSGIGAYGLMGLAGLNIRLGLELGSNIIVSCAVNIILGILCLHRGSHKVARRDM